MYARNLIAKVAPSARGTAKCVSSVAAPAKMEKIEKSVYISQSTDVHTNLALEEWLHRNLDFKNHHAMLFYKNDPCVLLGKAENPWLVSNISSQHESGDQAMTLARRQVDASVQYQDNGSMNLTFFADRLDNDYNLGVISRGIFRKYGLSLKKQEDHLSFYNMKLSESSSEMSHQNSAYQNCSLFVDVNKTNMEMAIGKDKVSVNDTYLNLSEVEPKVCTSGLLSAIGWEYLRTKATALKDGGEGLAMQQRGFQMINPTEEWFPGIEAIKKKYMQWDWCYGKTPKFTIFRSFPIPKEFVGNGKAELSDLRVKVDVIDGKIDDINLVVPPGLLSSGFTGDASIVTEIRGQRFTQEALSNIEKFLGLNKMRSDGEKFVTECVKKAMVI